jgi:hypothetical protein
MKKNPNKNKTVDGLVRRTNWLEPNESSAVILCECEECGHIFEVITKKPCEVCKSKKRRNRTVFPDSGAKTNRQWCLELVRDFHQKGIRARIEDCFITRKRDGKAPMIAVFAG